MSNEEREKRECWSSEDRRQALQVCWQSAKSIEHWYMTHKGKPWTLELVDTKMEAYGDWYLYIDPETGRYYEAYHSIGD